MFRVTVATRDVIKSGSNSICLRYASTAATQARRDSTNSTTFPVFNNASEVFSYADSNVARMTPSDVISLIRRADMAFGAGGRSVDREIREHPGYQKLIDAGHEAITSAPQDQLASLLMGLSNAGIFCRQPQIRSASEVILQRILNHEISPDPENFATLLNAVSRFQVGDIRVLPFLEETLPKVVPSMPLSECRQLLHSMHRLKFRNGQVHQLIREKLISCMDQFGNTDVVETLRVLAATNFSCNEVTQRCIDLLQNHTALFDVEELLTCGESLLLSGRMPPFCGKQIVQELKRNGRSLRGFMLLRALRMLQRAAPSEARFADELVGYALAAQQQKFEHQCLLAHAICYFELDSRKTALKNLMDGLLSSQNFPNAWLHTLMECIEASQHLMGVKVAVPEKFKSEWDSLNSTRRRPPVFLSAVFSELPETHRFNFEENQVIGPFVLAYVDKKAKVAVYLVEGASLEGRQIFRRLMKKYGYDVAGITLPTLQKVAPQNRAAVVEKMLNGLAIATGRITAEQASEQRGSQRR